MPFKTLTESQRKLGRNPRKTWLLDTKSFEKHYCRHQIRETSGWGGPSAVGDVGGGGASPESISRALTRRRMRNIAATEKPLVAVCGGPVA